VKFLDQFIPGRNIFVNKIAGQNAQILWPYLYYKKCISIDEPWFNYLIRKNSHSRDMFKGFENKLQQQKDHYDTFVATLRTITGLNSEERKRYVNLQETRFYSRVCPLCYQYCRPCEFRKYYKAWKNHPNDYYPIPKVVHMLYCLSFIPSGFSLVRRLKGHLK
jgi:hypothetical protein